MTASLSKLLSAAMTRFGASARAASARFILVDAICSSTGDFNLDRGTFRMRLRHTRVSLGTITHGVCRAEHEWTLNTRCRHAKLHSPTRRILLSVDKCCFGQMAVMQHSRRLEFVIHKHEHLVLQALGKLWARLLHMCSCVNSWKRRSVSTALDGASTMCHVLHFNP